jgi:CBS domain-containing protein
MNLVDGRLIMPLADIVKDEVVTIPPQAPVEKAARLMAEQHIGNLIVAEGTNGDRVPVGIITDRDIVVKIIAQGGEVKDSKVADIMTRGLITARAGDGIYETIERMRRHGVNRLPVLDQGGHLSGIVTAGDILKLLMVELSSLTALSEAQHAREEHHTDAAY